MNVTDSNSENAKAFEKFALFCGGQLCIWIESNRIRYSIHHSLHVQPQVTALPVLIK